MTYQIEDARISTEQTLQGYGRRICSVALRFEPELPLSRAMAEWLYITECETSTLGETPTETTFQVELMGRRKSANGTVDRRTKTRKYITEIAAEDKQVLRNALGLTEMHTRINIPVGADRAIDVISLDGVLLDFLPIRDDQPEPVLTPRHPEAERLPSSRAA